MIVLGITGSIAMGKSTVGAMLETLGVAVHEADAEVHALLAPGGAAVPAVGAAFPVFEYPKIYGGKARDGRRKLERAALGELVFHDDEQREKLESILHPYVQEAQIAFIKKQKALDADMVALDIPLLFETGAEERVDYTVNVSAPSCVQQARVMERPGMNEEKFQAILKRQMPDGEKCARADFVIHTGLGRAQSMKEIKAMLAEIKRKELGKVS